MRKTLGTAVLVLVLCGPAFAGDMLCPPAPTPPPTATYQEEPAADGVGTAEVSDTSDRLSEAVVDVLGIVLSLL